MEGKFTFTDAKDTMPEWVYDLFDTKVEALEEGFKIFPNGILIGRLKKKGVNYKIIDVMQFNKF